MLSAVNLSFSVPSVISVVSKNRLTIGLGFDIILFVPANFVVARPWSIPGEGMVTELRQGLVTSVESVASDNRERWIPRKGP